MDYDRLEWSFVKKCVSDLGFYDKWIMECITTTTLTILISGKTRNAFHPESGIRQGHSVSPYILLYVQNIHFMSSLQNSGIGINLTKNSPKIS